MPTARQLETFLCVADSGSMRVAADRLGISQPTISKQIRALEAKLGSFLFERRRGARLALSEHGEMLRSDAQKMLDLQRGLERLGRPSAAPRKLNVLVRQYFFSTIECELGDTKLAQSGVELSFEVIDRQDLIQEVVIRGEDAIGLLRADRIISNPQLSTSILSVDSCSLYASPSYIAQCGRDEDMISRYQAIVPEGGTHRAWALAQLASLGLPSENVKETGWYPGAVLRRIVEGDAAAILLDSHVRPLVATGKVEAVRTLTASLYLQMVSSKLLAPSVKTEIIEKIKGYLGD